MASLKVLGNFQKDNFGMGGKGNDAVVINVLNPSKFNSADFMTPPDGHQHTDEARGMGEGWSDVMALIVLAKSSDTATTGIPIVWASMLWEVYWNLVSKHGFSTNLYTPDQSAGNIVAMKIIIGAMMLQPCNPTFLSARDAIVAADALHYQGANKCEILKGFAKRGLGFKATSSYSNDFSLPPECQ
ncbi:hypothetical protein BASA60_009860 [Batrachochytrium salamandrivorans]|nr:hypothetical protein BASA60_009860 [Batrachochytrium salamandrivorans]